MKIVIEQIHDGFKAECSQCPYGAIANTLVQIAKKFESHLENCNASYYLSADSVQQTLEGA